MNRQLYGLECLVKHAAEDLEVIGSQVRIRSSQLCLSNSFSLFHLNYGLRAPRKKDEVLSRLSSTEENGCIRYKNRFKAVFMDYKYAFPTGVSLDFLIVSYLYMFFLYSYVYEHIYIQLHMKL